jgi:uncharacterized phiE125 gp8 family phage protein
MTDLTTIAAAKAFLNKSDQVDDVLLAALVASSSQYVRSWTNRDFNPQSYDLYRSGRGQTSILLPQWPVTAVTSVAVDGLGIALAPSFGAFGYRFTDRAVTLSGGAAFTHGTDNIHIVYQAGFVTIPADIAQATAELAAFRFKQRGDNIGWRSKSLAGEVVTFNTDDMPKAVLTVLKQYMNPLNL